MPAMQADLHASDGAIEWVVAGYGLTSAALLITAGRLGDQFGRRRCSRAGSRCSPSPRRRAAWPGAAGARRRPARCRASPRALLSPQVLSIIGVAYTGADRVRALSVYGIVLGLAAAGGQLVGGLLVQADIAGLGWRSCFLINVPIGLAALALAPRLVPESHAERSSRIDVAGTVLVTVGLTAVVLPLVEGRQHGWPLGPGLRSAPRPSLLGAFAAHQRRLGRRGGAPLLDPALFRDRALQRRAADPARVLGRPGVVLPRPRAVPPARARPDALQAGLVFTILAARYLAARSGAGAWPRVSAAGCRALGALVARGRPRAAARGRRRRRDGGSVGRARPRAAARRRRHGPRHHAADLDRPRVARAAAGRRGRGRPGDDAAGRQRDRRRGHRRLFFGALDHGFAHAFELSLAQLAVLCVARRTPAPAPAPP